MVVSELHGRCQLMEELVKKSLGSPSHLQQVHAQQEQDALMRPSGFANAAGDARERKQETATERE